MLQVSEKEVKNRLRLDNPWWDDISDNSMLAELPKRSYLTPFLELVRDRTIRRAVVLMGPRRVGKTVMVHHAISELLSEGVPSNNILYISIDTPIYTDMSLEQLLHLFTDMHGHASDMDLFLFFDEIQYLKNWEIHLKSAVDSYAAYKFIATGSAAAALKLKSAESGAGRFTDFSLPPLTFCEYLRFVGREGDLIIAKPARIIGEAATYKYECSDIDELNVEFVHYLNYGGYPEAVFSKTIQRNPSRFIKSDIIDKVLLRDLPSLYGITDVQELNRLFTVIAYNTGMEVNLEGLSQSSGVAKNTIKKYLEYLEAAFLINRIYRVNENAKRFKRQTYFKAYLTNSSIHAALFGNVNQDSDSMGRLTETAVYSQWLHHSTASLFYARWKKGEIDIVNLETEKQRATWAVEVKWSDAMISKPKVLGAAIEFIKNNLPKPAQLSVTSRTVTSDFAFQGVNVQVTPSSLYAYTVSKNIIRHKTGEPVIVIDHDIESKQLSLID